MVSFDMVSLFTRVPMRDSIELLRRFFEEDILQRFLHVLATSYLSLNDQFYKEINGIAIRSPQYPVNADFYMEDLEQRSFDLAPHKPLC
jgi:hypothetical protein